jgi:hypothetical protein
MTIRVAMLVAGVLAAVTSPGPSLDAPARAGAQAVRHRPARVILVGDSIAAALCHQLPTARCQAFPGAFVSSGNGRDFVAEFIATAGIHPGDVVVLSSVGGFHVAGVDDDEVVRRVSMAIDSIHGFGGRPVLLLSPAGGFPACGPNPSPQAIANFGNTDPAESCETMRRVRATMVASGEPTIDIRGPYMPDDIHQTEQAELVTADAIRDQALR